MRMSTSATKLGREDRDTKITAVVEYEPPRTMTEY